MIDHIHDLRSLDRATAYKIHRLARLLRVDLNQTFQRHGIALNLEQWFILFRLQEREACAQSELADKDLNDHPNITRMLDALEKRGLVVRQRDPSDRRRHVVSLTKAGERLMAELMPIIVEERKRVFAGISQAEIDQLVAIMAKIEKNIACP